MIMLFVFSLNVSYDYIITIFKPLSFIAAAIAYQVTTITKILKNTLTLQYYFLCISNFLNIKNIDFVIFIGNNIEPFSLIQTIKRLIKKNIILSKIKNVKLIFMNTSNIENISNIIKNLK